MKVIVDTSVWSLALRRKTVADRAVVAALESLIEDFRVQMIGQIRQEILSGIKSEAQFKELKSYFRAFSDYLIQSDDYELAAQYFNLCRANGIQGSNTDFLICAVAVNNKWQIFTIDQDFQNFSTVLPIQLFTP